MHAYIVQRGELQHAAKPTERDKASYFEENFQPIADAKQWDLVDGAIANCSPAFPSQKFPATMPTFRR